MILHELLGIDENESVFLAEESLGDLIYLPVTREILSFGLDFDRAVSIRGKGLALRQSDPEQFWLLLTDFFSESKVVQEFMSRIDGADAVYKDASSDGFLQAVIEYFSVSLEGELLCEGCEAPANPLHVQERIDRLGEFLGLQIPTGSSVLEIGCGSGMATRALSGLGLFPWTMDMNKCDVCTGLKFGFLDPQRTFVLDARLLGRFFAPASFDAVTGFMVGLIDGSNWAIWKEILVDASALAREMVLFTMYSEPEAKIVAEVMSKEGWSGEIIDNRGSIAIYDQWAYLGRKAW